MYDEWLYLGVSGYLAPGETFARFIMAMANSRGQTTRRSRHRRIPILMGGAAFAPSDIAGLQLWLDANDASTLFTDAAGTTPAGNGDVVGHWADKSGNSNNVTQATTSKKPTLQNGILNGLPVVRFDADDWLRINPFVSGTITQPNTTFVVYKISAVSGSTQVILGGVTNGNRQLILKDPAADKLGLFAGAVLLSGETADTNWHIASAVFNGASSFLRLDGTQIVSGNPGAENQEGATLAATFNAAGVLDGDEAEALEYGGELSAGDITLVENYFSNKWGVTLS